MEFNFEKVFGGDIDERMKFFSSLIPIIQERREKESLAYQFLEVKKLEPGEILMHPKEDDNYALFIASEENDWRPDVINKGTKVYPCTHWNTAHPKIGMEDIASRQYDIVNRVLDNVLFQLMFQDDMNFSKLLDYTITANKWCGGKLSNLTKKDTFYTNPKEFMKKLKEENNSGRVVINRKHFDLLRNIIDIKEEKVGEQVRYTTLGMPILFVASFEDFNLKVGCPIDGIYLLPSTPIGYKTLRVPLVALPADQFVFGKPQYGALFAECGSMSIIDTKNIHKIEL